MSSPILDLGLDVYSANLRAPSSISSLPDAANSVAWLLSQPTIFARSVFNGCLTLLEGNAKVASPHNSFGVTGASDILTVFRLSVNWFFELLGRKEGDLASTVGVPAASSVLIDDDYDIRLSAAEINISLSLSGSTLATAAVTAPCTSPPCASSSFGDNETAAFDALHTVLCAIDPENARPLSIFMSANARLWQRDSNLSVSAPLSLDVGAALTWIDYFVSRLTPAAWTKRYLFSEALIYGSRRYAHKWVYDGLPHCPPTSTIYSSSATPTPSATASPTGGGGGGGGGNANSSNANAPNLAGVAIGSIVGGIVIGVFAAVFVLRLRKPTTASSVIKSGESADAGGRTVVHNPWVEVRPLSSSLNSTPNSSV